MSRASAEGVGRARPASGAAHEVAAHAGADLGHGPVVGGRKAAYTLVPLSALLVTTGNKDHGGSVDGCTGCGTDADADRCTADR